VKVDPRIQFKRDDLAPTGLPDGTGFVPSAGPGSDGGMGLGSKGGMGPGHGPGVGEGDDGNIGGHGFHIGGRPRGTGDQPVVDSRPLLLNSPHPLYTEEARKNKVQGVVRVRVFVDASGAVREVIVTRALPDGLSEQAVRAAYQMRFRPALKDGRQISYWLSNVEIEFNLR
jgi:protein TonB